MNKEYILGLDIGGTKCALTVAKITNDIPNIIYKEKFPTEIGKPYDTLNHFSTIFDNYLKENELDYSNFKGIGISCGGPLNSNLGIVMSPPNLPGWDNIKIVEFFESKTNIKTYLQNDANACAVAEWKFGAGKGYKNVIFLTFGTGLGAGLILDGKLYRGTNDNAGEIGHVRIEKKGPIGYGKIGSCEGFCSGNGIKQLAIEAIKKSEYKCNLLNRCDGDINKVDAKIVAELANEGDEMCLSIYKTCAEKLGITLSILSDILDPEIIILGGIYMRSDNLIKDEMYKVINLEALIPCNVIKAGLGEKVGDYAALSIAGGDF